MAKAKTASKATDSAVLPTYISIDKLKIIKDFNPRTDVGNVDDLLESIKSKNVGIVTPLIVRPMASKEGYYEVIDGHRRLTVAKKLKMPEVPIRVLTNIADDTDALAIAVGANTDGNRSNLNPIDEANALKKLSDSGKYTPNKIASMTGCTGQKVRMALRLLEAPKSVLKRVKEGTLSKSAAITIAGLDEEIQNKVLPEIGENATEREIKETVNRIAKAEAADAEEAGEKPKKVTKGSRTKLPAGGGDGLALWRGKKEVRERIEDLVEQIEQDGEDVDALRNQLAALLWAAGEIDAISIDSTEFKNAYKRTVESMDWDEEAEAEEEKPAKGKKGKKEAKEAKAPKGKKGKKAKAEEAEEETESAQGEEAEEDIEEDKEAEEETDEEAGEQAAEEDAAEEDGDEEDGDEDAEDDEDGDDEDGEDD